MEAGAWREEIELMETAMAICTDKNSHIYALLANSRGEMEVERAHCAEAEKYMSASLRIFQHLYGPDHPEVGSGWNNTGNIILQDMREGACEEAIRHYELALTIFEKCDIDIGRKLFFIPHTNLARAYLVLRNNERAVYHAEQSRKWAVAYLGQGCHFDGLADYYVGNARFNEGDVDSAEHFWTRALASFERENEIHGTSVAARLKLAMVRMSRGDHVEAIANLRRLLIVAKLKKSSKGDNGEVARVQRKLAEALELAGETDEAQKLKTEAEAMRREIQGSRFEDLPDCDLSYAMMNFHAFW